jgi:Ser/Thr protein kinase RdoA (MazF antagonist)
VEGPLRRLLGTTKPVTSFDHVPAGRRSIVYFVDIEGQPRGVFRAERSWYRAMALLSNMRHLHARGLPAPRLLATDRSLVTFLRWGFLPILEERIEGTHPQQASDKLAALRSVAATLARMHAVQRTRWGTPRLPRWGRYRPYYLGRIKAWARLVVPVVDEPEDGAILPWFLDRARECPFDPPFSLLHASIRPDNFIVTEEGPTVPIDLSRLRYGCFATDLAWALKRMCAGDATARAEFEGAYFAGGGQERRQSFERSERFFLAAYELSRLATYARRLRSPKSTRWRGEEIERFSRLHLEQLAKDMGIALRLKPM